MVRKWREFSQKHKIVDVPMWIVLWCDFAERIVAKLKKR